MRWEKGRRSKNVIDGRGRAKQGATLGGGAIIMALIAYFLFGQNPAQVLQGVGGGQQSQSPAKSTPGEDRVMDFLSVVLGDTEDVWGQLFAQSGSRYRQPQLEIFRGQVRSACGMASAASGPFYCPGDSKLYMDLSFL
ncbi:MAG: neutral zinc metallopeptidase, partial [Pseudomonadota bacterium]